MSTNVKFVLYCRKEKLMFNITGYKIKREVLVPQLKLNFGLNISYDYKEEELSKEDIDAILNQMRIVILDRFYKYLERGTLTWNLLELIARWTINDFKKGKIEVLRFKEINI